MGRVVLLRHALAAQDAAKQVGRNEFWPLETGLAAMNPAIRERLSGPGQIIDAILFEAAMRRRGKLATFDQCIRALAAGACDAALEVIPA